MHKQCLMLRSRHVNRMGRMRTFPLETTWEHESSGPKTTCTFIVGIIYIDHKYKV